MPLFRVHAYDDEHWATLVIRAETQDDVGAIARQFVAMMHLGYYPANHERECPEVVRVEQANSSWFQRRAKAITMSTSASVIAQ